MDQTESSSIITIEQGSLKDLKKVTKVICLLYYK